MADTDRDSWHWQPMIMQPESVDQKRVAGGGRSGTGQGRRSARPRPTQTLEGGPL